MLMQNSPAPERPFFWHFPHYTNQGSRPSGAMRDKNWMLVEYYDDKAVELYDLAKDLAEARDLAKENPARVKQMRAALVNWRRNINAQTNRPNPSFDPARFQELYVDVDPGKFAPAHASPSQWQKMWKWRKEMNAVLPKNQKN
jgi:hypothetical protein